LAARSNGDAAAGISWHCHGHSDSQDVPDSAGAGLWHDLDPGASIHRALFALWYSLQPFGALKPA
jgi:hypothetical protein